MNKQILLFTCLLAISSPALGQEGAEDAPAALSTGDQITAPAATPAEATPAAKIDPKCDCLKQCMSTKQLDASTIKSALEPKFKSNPILDFFFSDKDYSIIQYLFGEGVSGFSTLNVPELKRIQEACLKKGDPSIETAKQCFAAMSGDIPDLGNILKQHLNEAIDTIIPPLRDLPNNLVNIINECKASCSAEDNLTCPPSSFLEVDIIAQPDISKITSDISNNTAKVKADLRNTIERAVQSATSQSSEAPKAPEPGATGQSEIEAGNTPAPEE